MSTFKGFPFCEGKKALHFKPCEMDILPLRTKNFPSFFFFFFFPLTYVYVHTTTQLLEQGRVGQGRAGQNRASAVAVAAARSEITEPQRTVCLQLQPASCHH